MARLLARYHALPTGLRAALAFSAGAIYAYLNDLWTNYSADAAAHQHSVLDWHQVAIHCVGLGVSTFIAHAIPFNPPKTP